MSTRRLPPKNEIVPAASTISSTEGVGPSSTVVSGSSRFSFQIDIVLDSGLYQCRQIFDITVKIFHSLIIRSPFFNLFIQILYTKTE